MVFDSSDTIRPETSNPVLLESIEDTPSDVVGGDVSVAVDQSPDSTSDRGCTPTDTITEEDSSFWSPHDSDGFEGLSQERSRISSTSSPLSVVKGSLFVEAMELLLLTVSTETVAPIAVMKAADKGGEVALPVSDIAAMNLIAKGTFCSQ